MDVDVSELQKNKIEEQYSVLTSNVTSVVEKAELKRKIKDSVINNKPLNVKLGLDPSAPDIHLGHLVVLKKLKQFQQFGYKIHLVIGDFTGMIGDPTGKSESRVQLSKEEVEKNARTYVEQFGRILDMRNVEVHYNSSWLEKLNIKNLIDLLSTTTVARMLERNDFTKRFNNQTPIYLHEFLYPLFQGYDSVALHSDVELGGNDQQYNLLVGRRLQDHFDQSKQVVMTMPLLVGLDGKMKMSKSKHNYIGITEKPDIIFGKIMSIPDIQMLEYYKSISTFSDKEIDVIEKKMNSNLINPKDVKVMLAKDIIKQLYNQKSADSAEQEFNNVFKKGQVPNQIPNFAWNGDSEVSISTLFTTTSLLPSKGAAMRMLKNGGLRINSKKLKEGDSKVTVSDGMIIQVGKRKFLRIKY
ncbi:tyrosine--tRNA ligase [Companilactobacillus alimentarius]